MEETRFSCFLSSSPQTAGKVDGGIRVSARVWVQPGPSIPLEIRHRAKFRERFLAGYPLIWVEDGITTILSPFWIPHDWFRPIAELRPGNSPAQLPGNVADALRWAGVLCHPDQEGEASERRRGALRRAKEGFGERGYANVGNLLHPGQVAALRSYFQRRTMGLKQIGDNQCDRRYAIHNESVARFYHHQLASVVAHVVGESVVPSYCYFVGYTEGAELARHVDRPQCEFSATLLVDFHPLPEDETPWPLWLDTSHGPVPVHQSLGDALIYRGRRLPHWRTALPNGSRSYSLLLHYVSPNFSGQLR